MRLRTLLLAAALGLVALVLHVLPSETASWPAGAGAMHGPEPTCFREIIGDWDGDGLVTLNDAYQLLRVQAGLPETVHVHCGWMDATCDNREDIQDVMAILLNFAGLAFDQVADRHCVCLGEATGPIGGLPTPPTPTPIERLCRLP